MNSPTDTHSSSALLEHRTDARILDAFKASGSEWRTIEGVARDGGVSTQEVEAYVTANPRVIERTDFEFAGQNFYRLRQQRKPVTHHADISTSVQSQPRVGITRLLPHSMLEDTSNGAPPESWLRPWQNTLVVISYITAWIVTVCFTEAVLFGFYWFFEHALKIHYSNATRTNSAVFVMVVALLALVTDRLPTFVKAYGRKKPKETLR